MTFYVDSTDTFPIKIYWQKDRHFNYMTSYVNEHVQLNKILNKEHEIFIVTI